MRYAGLPVSGGIKPQSEATAYFARMTTAPSKAWRDAVNEAVYEWKRQGVWSLILGLWLFCAETDQAALLSVIGDTPRDATKTGAPVFTASKGYGSFSATVGITMPITSAILADDNVFPFIAGVVDGTATGATFLRSDAGTGTTNVGHFHYDGSVKGGPNPPIITTNAANSPFIGGTRGGSKTFNPGGIGAGGGSSAARSSNYRTNEISGSPLTRLSAYGFLANTATDVQCLRFLAILANLLNNKLGALE